ncbi:MAG: hypothetical protein AB1327_11330 [Bacillota bacterium]
MRIRVIQVRDRNKALSVVSSLRLLADARHDLPVRLPGEWLGSLPGLRHQAKVYLVVLHPRAGEPQGWELAWKATRVLERRHEVVLDWACGFRASGAVWVLIKPWAARADTGRRTWFWVTPEALAELHRVLGHAAASGRAGVRACGLNFERR